MTRNYYFTGLIYQIYVSLYFFYFQPLITLFQTASLIKQYELVLTQKTHKNQIIGKNTAPELF